MRSLGACENGIEHARSCYGYGLSVDVDVTGVWTNEYEANKRRINWQKHTDHRWKSTKSAKFMFHCGTFSLRRFSLYLCRAHQPPQCIHTYILLWFTASVVPTVEEERDFDVATGWLWNNRDNSMPRLAYRINNSHARNRYLIEKHLTMLSTRT